MLHILANPGVFQSPPIQWFLSLLFAAVIVPILFIALVYSDTAGARALAKNGKSGLAVGILIVTSVIGLIAFIFGLGYTNSQKELAQAKYNSSVINWLDSGYGIKVNTNVAQRLVYGETFVTNYHSKSISFSIIKNINGDLAVVDSNKTVLEPNK